MFCPKCGVENADDREQCASCNWALSGSTAQPTIEAKTSRLAIATLVLGILIITALPAFICGIFALIRIANSKGQLKGVGLVITGMVLPCLILAILGFLAAMLMPMIGKIEPMARRLVCATNLRTLSTAVQEYSYDYDDFPTGDKWCDLLQEHAELSSIIFHCKAAPEGTYCYGFNSNLLEEHSLDGKDLDLVMMFEIQGGRNVTGGPELLYIGRHEDEGCNIAYVDGHVEFIRMKDLPNLKWKP